MLSISRSRTHGHVRQTRSYDEEGQIKPEK